MRKDLIALLCKKREVQSRRQIVALTALGTRSLGDIVISRSALPFLDAFCKREGIVDEPVIFQTSEDFRARKQSVLGKGMQHEEIALWWILGEMNIVSFQSSASILTGSVLQKIFRTCHPSSI